MPIEIQKQPAGDGVFMEHDYAVLTDLVHKKTPIESVIEQIRPVGSGRCVIATDAGQPINPDLIAGLKDFIARLIAKGITEDEVDLMARKNPKILLDT
jgi:predicted metal-dependent phosphotriesterase family hydrolase